ncbi:MAG: hypothetical protein ACKVOI_20235 [Dongiaceae bacterium]
MDISPYLRKPLRSLREVVETLKPASTPETVPADLDAAAVPQCAVEEPLDPSKT